jgi:hypothetical protein
MRPCEQRRSFFDFARGGRSKETPLRTAGAGRMPKPGRPVVLGQALRGHNIIRVTLLAKCRSISLCSIGFGFIIISKLSLVCDGFKNATSRTKTIYKFVSWDYEIPNIRKKKKCSKPPTSIDSHINHTMHYYKAMKEILNTSNDILGFA